MPISVRCSKCGHSYQLRDELAGKQAKCRCGQTLSIPIATQLTSLLDEEHIGDSADEMGMGEAMPMAAAPYQGQRLKSSAKFGKGFQKKKGGKDNSTVIVASVAAGVGVVFVVLLALFLFTGPEDKPVAIAPPVAPVSPVGPPAVTSLPGQATPQETFETFKRAWVAKNWTRVYSLLTPEAQQQMTSVIAMMSAMLGPMDPDFAAVAKKYGIESTGLAGLAMGGAADPFAEGQPDKQAKPDANALVSQAMGVAAKIQDQKAFFIDAMPVFLKFVQSKQFAGIATIGSQFSGVSINEGFDMLPMFTAATTLSDVQINGHTAAGFAKTPTAAAPSNTPPAADAAKEKITPLKFDQRVGSWYIGGA